MSQVEDLIKTNTQKILKFLNIEPLSIDLQSKDDAYHLDIKVNEPDSGLLIGYHGDNISHFQQILNQLVFKQTDSWPRIVLNVGDYRQKREESLLKLADTNANKVKFTSEPIALFHLNPYERRLIHTHLKKNKSVTTESQGEGKDRHLIIKPEISSDEPATS